MINENLKRKESREPETNKVLQLSGFIISPIFILIDKLLKGIMSIVISIVSIISASSEIIINGVGSPFPLSLLFFGLLLLRAIPTFLLLFIILLSLFGMPIIDSIKYLISGTFSWSDSATTNLVNGITLWVLFLHIFVFIVAFL